MPAFLLATHAWPAQLDSVGALVAGLLGLVGLVALFRRLDGWGRALLGAGLAVLAAKLAVIAPIEFIGTGDSAAYAEMAHSLIQGRGLEVDYVSWYFDRYDPGIARPEDHWPPLLSVLIAPFFLALGRDAVVAKLPNLVISCLVLPLVGQSLGRLLSRSSAVGFAVGLSLLLNSSFVHFSLYCLADVALATLSTASIWLLLRGLERPNALLGMGVLAALAILAKGTGIVVLPVCVLCYLLLRRSRAPGPLAPTPWLAGRRLWVVAAAGELLCMLYDPVWAGLVFLPGWIGLVVLGRVYAAITGAADASSSPRRPKGTRDRIFLVGLGLALVVLSPYLVRNTAHFGHPMYSTNQYVSGYIGLKRWEETTYKLYWGEDQPSFGDRLADWERYREWVRDEVVRNGWQLLVDSNSRPSVQPLAELDAWPTGALAAMTWVTLCLAGLAGLVGRTRGSRAPPADSNERWSRLIAPWQDGPLHVTWVFAAAWIVFLSLVWGPWSNRFLLPARAVAIAAAWVGLHRLLVQILSTKPLEPLVAGRSRRFASLLVLGIFLPVVTAPQVAEVSTFIRERARYPYTDSNTGLIATSRWLAEHVPDAVVMTRSPWVVHFYAQVPAVQIPNTELAEVVSVARYFGVTHLIGSKARPHLDPWASGEVPGLVQLPADGVRVYEIRYDQLPPELRDLPPLPPP